MLRSDPSPESSCRGKFLVSADSKTLIIKEPFQIQDLDTGRDRSSLGEHSAGIQSLTVSEKGPFLISHDRLGAVRVWDMTQGALQTMPKTNKEEALPNICRFVAGGKSLVTIRDGEHVQFRDTRTGKGHRFSLIDRPPIHTWQQWFEKRKPADPPTGLVLSHDNRMLAVRTAKDSVVVWDVTTGKRLATLADAGGTILHFTKDGKSLVFLDADRLQIRSLDGKLQTEFPRPLKQEEMAFSADGRYYACVKDDSLQLHDLKTGKKCWSKPDLEISVRSFGFTDDSTGLVVWSEDELFTTFDLKTGQALPGTEKTAEENRLVLFLYSDPQQRPTTLEAEMEVLDNALSFPFRCFYTQRRSLQWSRNSDERYAISPDRRFIACTSGTEVWLVESRSGRRIASFAHHHRGNVNCLLFSADGRTLITGGEDSTIMLWDWVAATNLKPSSPTRPNSTTWDELADKDAGKAYRALYQLLAHPEESISLLKEHLKPTTQEEVGRIRQWIGKLNDDRHAVREQAQAALLRSGEQSLPLLQAAWKLPASEEAEQRIRRLLASAELSTPNREGMRQVRAIQALEWMNTPQSRRMLEELAKGEPDTLLTREAHAALNR